jgi:two-component system sensor kinase FixL
VRNHAFATHLYRIAQEAVNNAIRHGDPASISIQFSRQNGNMRLSVRDDGSGVPAESARHNGDGMGLHIMRYRARMIDATLKINPAPDRGTIVSCYWSAGADAGD